jgi:hypothetical protein
MVQVVHENPTVCEIISVGSGEGLKAHERDFIIRILGATLGAVREEKMAPDFL